MRSFLSFEKPPVCVMIAQKDPEKVLETEKKALLAGAEAFGIQAEKLRKKDQNASVYRSFVEEAGGAPLYATFYRRGDDAPKTEEEAAKGILELAESGMDLIDVMGDLFDPQPGELTRERGAVKKQKDLINALHEMGKEVLISTHTFHFLPGKEVLEIAKAQESRGADIVKIVTGAETPEEEVENMKTSLLLKETLSVPFLFLSAGHSALLRRIGPNLGSCMYLGVYEQSEWSTKAQPLLSDLVRIRELMG